MDSRIEELAEIILERAKGVADQITERNHSDTYRTYRRIERQAVDILAALREYRADHPEEYK
jgi:hypothetical protein